LIEGMEVGKKPLPDGPVTIGIRPEGFLLDPSKTAPFHFDVDLVETIGRDTTLIFDMKNDTVALLDKKSFKAIIDASFRIKPGDITHFTIKPDKMHLFDKSTGIVL